MQLSFSVAKYHTRRINCSLHFAHEASTSGFTSINSAGVRAQQRNCFRMNLEADNLCAGVQTRRDYAPLRCRTLHWSTYLYTDRCWFFLTAGAVSTLCKTRFYTSFLTRPDHLVPPKNRTGPAYNDLMSPAVPQNDG
jgi:hypothetical protein